MEFDPEIHAGYISPLTDKEHARLGRIAVLWGQIESMIDMIYPAFCDLKPEELTAMGIYDAPIAKKAHFLKTVSKCRAAPAVNEMVTQFVTLIENTNVDRNHAFHSM